MKWIEKKQVVPLDEPYKGYVSDTINVEDKVTNAPSIGLAQRMMGIPTDGIISFDGDEIPEGYEEVKIGYSTEETLTGETWIDGKPIYRKVFPFSVTTATSTTTQVMNVEHQIENVDEIFVNQGKSFFQTRRTVDAEKNPARFIFGRNYFANEKVTFSSGVTVTPSAIGIELYSSGNAYEVTGVVTVEYTKTTD